MAHLFKWLPVCGSDLTIYNTFSSWSASICSSLRSSCLFRDCCDSISRWRLWKNQTIEILKFYVYVIIWISIIWMCMHSILTFVLQWSNYLHVHIKNTRYFSCNINMKWKYLLRIPSLHIVIRLTSILQLYCFLTDFLSSSYRCDTSWHFFSPTSRTLNNNRTKSLPVQAFIK